MKEYIIRKATTQDLPFIQKLNHKLFIKEYRDFDKTLDKRYPYTKIGKQYFVFRATMPRQGVLVVAESKGKIIGYLAGGLQKRKISRLPARYAELENMIVESTFRGEGIGSELIKYFFDWCAKKKVNYISVTASGKNSRAQKLYHKMGFANYDVKFLKKL